MSFPYTLSNAAKRGSGWALDVRDIGETIQLALLEDMGGGQWSFLGSSPVWSVWVSVTQEYTHPGQATESGTALAIINKYGDRMINDYLPEVNRRLAARFSGAAPPTVATTQDEARQMVANYLFNNYTVSGNSVVRK